MPDYDMDLDIDRIDNLSVSDVCQICEIATSHVLPYFKNILLRSSRSDQSHVDRIKLRLLWYMGKIKEAYGHNDEKNVIVIHNATCIVILNGRSDHSNADRAWGPVFFHRIGPIALSRLLQMLYKHAMANLEIKIQSVHEVSHLESLNNCEVDIEAMMVNLNLIANHLHSDQVHPIDNDTRIIYAKLGVKIIPVNLEN
jgi:hypothetical protein